MRRGARRASAMQAFSDGTLKIAGDMSVGQRFGPHLFDMAKLEAVSGVSANGVAGGEGFKSEEVRCRAPRRRAAR